MSSEQPSPSPQSNGAPQGNGTLPNGDKKSPYAAKDLITRGIYRSNPLGTSTFVGLRALDPLLQYNLLGGKEWGQSLLSTLGISSIPLIDQALTTSPDIDISASLLSASTNLGLPLPRLILLLMATGSSIKQIFWILFVSKEEMKPNAAIPICMYNTFVNSLASLLLLATHTSSSLSTHQVSIPVPVLGTLSLPLPMAIGSVLYIAGISLETVSEINRKHFKDDPNNKGQICDIGLWGRARHINYGGYTLWRTGYALAAGGWIAGAAVAAWHYWTFAYRSIGLMDEYMSGRYQEKWAKYKKDVPWKLFPGVY